jgi:methanogenic corrinoid protein MtbC1
MDKQILSEGYNIRVASRMTGLPADTLRIWERRYGFPRPERSGRGTSAYREEDITALRLIAQALKAGFRPGDVVGRPVEELAGLVRAAAAATPQEAPVTASVEPVLAALARDDLGAVRAGLRSAAVTLGPERFVKEMAHPLAVQAGEGWAAGRLSVRQEHLLTALLSDQLRLLASAQEESGRRPVVVLTTLPGELHDLGLQMVALILSLRGATPRYLGAQTPPEEVAGAAQALGAEVVGLGVSPSADPVEAARLVRQLLDGLPRRVRLWLGGAGAPRLGLAPHEARLVTTWEQLDEALAEALGQGGGA